ncbi:MAG TPA: AAA family ATPase [Terriglobales bacterium]|nr:AAA family ATPase [Terriglobales bacterium]
MFLRALTLQNFRSHQETVLELDRFNFIRGPNGCGKSSVQMALEYLFTGRCKLTDGAGRGAKGLIRVGEEELEVSATFENGEAICRRRTARSHIVEINGKRVPVDTAEAALEKRFGPAEILSAVLNADRFVAMPETEQKKFLAQVVDTGRTEIPEQTRDAPRSMSEAELKLASIPIRTEDIGEGSAAATKDAHNSKLDVLKHLVDFSGSNGAVIHHASRRLEPLKAKLNQQLAIFSYVCNLTVQPFEIRVSHCGDGPGFLLKQLSESERFRFGIAFQLALAMVTGIRFVVIDRADVLDRAKRKELTSLLLRSEIEQAIVLATGEEPPRGTIPGGVRFIDLPPATKSAVKAFT